ncbi:ANL family adenylate-forming protein [Coraliomargarita sinensis]|uniref:ANL family adenylate-forming protein n=1 Tax=Coraliomargarita sinensis TaxID=2174842 RepID=UPI001E2A20EE|nr:fatty acid--CoA ligase family protein [Coraliomargarita sinensis]
MTIETASTVEGLAQLIAIADTNRIALPLPPSLPDTERKRMRGIAQNSPLYDKLSGSGLILFSSGTSGEPKGMLHKLSALLNRFEPLPTRKDRTLQLLLIDHIGGLDAAFRCLFSGSTLIIPEARTPEDAGRAIETHKVNILPASPTFLNLMLMNSMHEHYDCSSVEIIAYGAEAMPAPLLQRLRASFPNADLQQKFGTSETGAVRIESQGSESLFFRIKDPDTEWKIIEDELWLKTPSRIIGYLNADESSLEADGWYRTGDLVEEGPNGSIRIIGRQSATINVGGQKVHPSEVEAVLLNVDGIDACHVYGEPDPITGQRVACRIFSSEEKDSLAWKRAIRNHCRGKLAPWKIPSNVTIGDQLSVNTRMKRD